ncbi:MAG TPA: hypothetical protein DDZ89_19135, partial [Clostridiales bacterium]|nr:hypothetical protein [Clostridiales bacterium]
MRFSMSNDNGSVKEWLTYFDDQNCRRDQLIEIYGNDQDLICERIKDYKHILKLHHETYGTRDRVVIARSPGRINLMGKHIDHQGGHVNVMAINKEILLVASAREDDEIHMVNTDPAFPNRSFHISQCFENQPPKDWFSYIKSDFVKESFKGCFGDWVHYVKGVILRLQTEFSDRKLCGMNMAFSGNIPISAGLSGSSALVVSTLEAYSSLNQLDLTKKRSVELCGEGEWYVGLNNGFSDPAAMKYAQRGHMVKLSFRPFVYEKTFAFPEEYKIVVADSYVKANKTGNAKDTYNQRVATYGMGMLLLSELFPEYMKRFSCLRDIQSDSLGMSTQDIYRMLAALPEQISIEQLYKQYPREKHENLRKLLKTHNPFPIYFVRGVMLYGIAECRRARLCSDLIEQNRMEEFGEWMTISHDGDRVCKTDDQGNRVPYNNDWSAGMLY